MRLSYVQCPLCESSRFLIEGIKEVIGLIGGDIEEYIVDKDKVYVNLWSEEKEEASALRRLD